jgi:glyoxylase I family protein
MIGSREPRPPEAPRYLTRGGRTCILSGMVGAFEHLALNVRDQKAVEDWYVENLGFTVVRRYPAGASFLADSAGRIVFELYSRDDVPYFDGEGTHSLTVHIAYECQDVEGTAKALLSAGATEDIPLATSPDGDVLIILRDPFGITIQLIDRADPLR